MFKKIASPIRKATSSRSKVLLRFPHERLDKPPKVDGINTNLFWRWSISNEYFCHANWDSVNLDVWWGRSTDNFRNLHLLPLGSSSPSSSRDLYVKERSVRSTLTSDTTESSSAYRGVLVENALTPEEDNSIAVGTWHFFPDGQGGLSNLKRRATIETIVIVKN
jgi:hypothetical protein